MKKLLLSLLFIAAALGIQAQDAKPTKEETIGYLKNILMNPNGVSFLTSVTGITFVYRVLSLSFSECSLIIEMDLRSPQEKKQGWYNTVYTIDVSKVEKADADGNQIRLTAKDHALLIQKKYISNVSGSETVEHSFEGEAKLPCPLEKEKVIKAFNHLRKLCGAPEPIEF